MRQATAPIKKRSPASSGRDHAHAHGLSVFVVGAVLPEILVNLKQIPAMCLNLGSAIKEAIPPVKDLLRVGCYEEPPRRSDDRRA